MRLVTALLLAVAPWAFAETAAYIYGLGGIVAGDYNAGDDVYQKVVGTYVYLEPPPGPPYEAALTGTDLAVTPFAFGMKGDEWRMAFELNWNRHAAGPADDRPVNNGRMRAGGGYIFNRGFFAGKRVQPYFGALFNGTFTKAGNMHNGVIAYGFGPDLGILIPLDLNHSGFLITAGYQYKRYSLTGTRAEDLPAHDLPTAPYFNYTYIPTSSFPTSAASYYVGVRTTLRFHRRIGLEAHVRYDGDVSDSFDNGVSFQAGPSLWL